MKKFIILLFLILTGALLLYSQNTKECEFAGSFYPKDPQELNSLMESYLSKAQISPIKGNIIGVICPHAGYIYSGPVAAFSYKALQGKKFDTIIILGPSHRYPFNGISIYPQGAFSCPLGKLEIDEKGAAEFKALSFITYEPAYFEQEHNIEVQLPFILKALGKVKIIPMVFGRVNLKDLQQFADKLKAISRQKNILVIASSDFSHYHPYAEANEIDAKTVDLIKKQDADGLWKSEERDEGRACGINPIIAFILYANARGAKIDILHYANSGDTAGDKSRVVGYVSAIAYSNENSKNTLKEDKEETMAEYSLNNDEKKTLLKIARSTLEGYLKNEKIPEFKGVSQNLQEKQGAFVTLKKHGELRGCIGRIVADTPLYEVVSSVAIDSATQDPRFQPVQYRELKDIEIEISVLTPFEKVNDINEIEVGKHGLLIRKGFYSGLLLPQVPGEYGWDRETFLEHTCLKAGLPAKAYKDKDAILYKFSAIVFNESDFKK